MAAKIIRILIPFLLMVSLTGVYASDYDLSRVDVSEAIISIAGPRHLYIRAATYDSREVSFIVESEDTTGRVWKVKEIFTEDLSHIPDNIYLDFAEITPVSPEEIEVRGIIVDGQAYTAKMTILDPETLGVGKIPLQGDFTQRYYDAIAQAAPPAPMVDEQAYKAQIQVLTEEKEEFAEQITQLKAEQIFYNTQINSLTLSKEQCELQIEKLEKQMGELIIEEDRGGITLKDLEQAKEEYEKTIEELERESQEQEWEILALQATLEDMDQQIAVLTEVNRELKTSFQDALEQLVLAMEPMERSPGEAEDHAVVPAAPATAETVFTKTLLTGFSGGSPQMGRWKITEGEVVQKDASQYFAKLIIPIEQTTKPTLFSFKARSTGDGWVGLGLHFFATDMDRRKGYGYGDSLLFWLTRDPEYHGNMDTHAQLYKSDDAVHMAMVLDSVIEESISDYMQVDIIYNPLEEYFSIFINGIEKLKYKTWFSIESGLEIAFRTLKGGCSFKDLVVKTMD